MVHQLQWLAGMKSLLIFIVFYALYISLSVVRLDWWEGHKTLSWLHDAHEIMHITPPEKMTGLEQISEYIEHEKGLGRVIAELHHTCVGCQVGITPLPRDMAFLTLDDFVCSDFDSQSGSNEYPARDCKTADAEWAARPISTSAPCCRNSTLVTASIGMMTEQLKYGLEHMPLEKLLKGGSDGTFGATEYFLQHNIESKGFLLQFVVSREQRMAAVAYHVPKYDLDAPARVKPIATFWSFNYHAKGITTILASLLMISGLYVVAHQMRELWDLLRQEQGRSRQEAEMPRASANGGGPVRRPSRVSDAVAVSGSCFDILRRTFEAAAERGVFTFGKYQIFVEIPSVLAPLMLEVMRPHMLLSQWTFLVACTEMIMTVRLLQEGRVIPALRLVINTIEAAMPNIIALLIVLGPTTMLTAVMHSQIFGLFDDGFADPFVALTRVVRMLTSPPPQETIEGVDGHSAPVGAEVMYYWGTIVIRLCFGSFVVAILVGAFNKVSGNLAEEEKRLERSTKLPEGYFEQSDVAGPGVPVSQLSMSVQRACEGIGYVTAFPAFTTLHGTPLPRLIASFKEEIEVKDAEEANQEKEIFINADELDMLCGSPHTSKMLLDRYGVKVESKMAV